MTVSFHCNNTHTHTQHHAIELTRGTENIVQNSFINTKHVHDLSLELYIVRARVVVCATV